MVDLCKKQGIRPGYVLGGVSAVVVLVGTILQGFNIAYGFLTCFYPILASIRALESPEEEDDKLWLSFWTVFGIV